MEGFYADAASLPAAGIDALIVTGAEPRTADLRDEPYWQALAHLIDWAEIGTVSTLFSCLAAHAAVLHLDGIVRRPLPRKLSRRLRQPRAGDDPLLAGLPARAAMPHSRRNGLSESDLVAQGLSHPVAADRRRWTTFTRDAGPQPLCLSSRAIPNMAPRPWAGNICATSAASCGAKRPAPAIPENYFDRVTENALADAGRRGDGPDRRL